MGKSAPKPPDPFETAEAQAGVNREAAITTAQLNAVNQFSPFGSTTFGTRTEGELAGTPESQTITLNPVLQQALEQQFQTQLGTSTAAANLSQGLPQEAFNLDDLPSGLPVAQALANRQFDIIRPEIDRTRDLLNIQLSERGIPIGSEISNEERDRFERGVGQTFENIANQSILAATREEDRQLQRALTARNQTINEIAASLQGSGAINTPGFINVPAQSVAPPDIQGLVSQNFAAQQAQFNSQQAAKGNLLGSLGSAAVGIF